MVGDRQNRLPQGRQLSVPVAKSARLTGSLSPSSTSSRQQTSPSRFWVVAQSNGEAVLLRTFNASE